MTFDFVFAETNGLCAECFAQAHRDREQEILEDRQRRRKKPPQNLPELAHENAPREFNDFLDTCDDYCVVACCGLYACDISPPRIMEWLNVAGEVPYQKLIVYFDDLAERMAHQTESIRFMGDPWLPAHLHLWAREFVGLLRYSWERLNSGHDD
jgi:hypothetical protein